LAAGAGLPGRAWESRQPHWVPDVAVDPHSRRGAPALSDGLHACVLLPALGGEGEILGVMELLSKEVRPADPVALEVLNALADQVGQFLERKRAEAALERSARQARQILDTAYEAFISIDERGLVTGWNPQAEVTFGWSREEALGRELAETIIPEGVRDAHRHGMKRFLATGEGRVLGKVLELTALHRGGREFPVELTISASRADEGYSFNAFVRDISERKRTEDELERARDEALEASKMKSMFVANVSHEIRTPLNGVIGMTGLLLDTKLDDEQREYAETVSSSGETLLGVINDILDVSKIEAGKLELDRTDFDPRDLIEKACGMLAAGAHEKGVELVVAIDPDVPSQVHGDAARLRQVIANLVANAIKFTSSGEVLVRANAERDEDGSALLRFEVSDTGIGIDRGTLEKLFKPFSQADGSTTRKYGGTGLGLAISRHLIELMDGKIGAESEPGQGSRFWFELAVASAGDDDRQPDGRRPGQSDELAGLRVLVVDDNATNRTILERQLSSWGMVADGAAGAQQALELLEQAADAGEPFALALLDLHMPKVDGCELAREIRARPALGILRVMLLTSSGGRAEVSDNTGIDGFLTKPVRQSRLYAEIQAVMAGERAGPGLVERRRPPGDGSGEKGMAAPVVLVAEDTQVNQAVAARMLEKGGFRVELAANGREAIDALSERSYAAVLMDCQMPELDGYEATRKIRDREQGRHTPIIAMTASSMEGDRERCLAVGMDDYLSKPLRARALTEALGRWVPSGDRASGVLDEAVIGDLQDLEPDALSKLLSMYFEEASSQLSALEHLVGRSDAPAAAKVAHKLKGSSGAVGAARIAGIAKELEIQALDGDLGNAGELLDRLGSALGDTEAAFRSSTELSLAP
ncbi:MAG: response regulator, partial [Thermoleophilaceae bacterium]|nr:response regulator [Thermoleophilaceae bacterium]